MGCSDLAIRLFLCLEYSCYKLSILSFIGLRLEGAFLHCFSYKALLQLRPLSLKLCLRSPQQQMLSCFHYVTDIYIRNTRIHEHILFDSRTGQWATNTGHNLPCLAMCMPISSNSLKCSPSGCAMYLNNVAFSVSQQCTGQKAFILLCSR